MLGLLAQYLSVHSFWAQKFTEGNMVHCTKKVQNKTRKGLWRLMEIVVLIQKQKKVSVLVRELEIPPTLVLNCYNTVKALLCITITSYYYFSTSITNFSLVSLCLCFSFCFDLNTYISLLWFLFTLFIFFQSLFWLLFNL